MSRFCGRFDLYDEMFMMNDGAESELVLFYRFKDATGGVIYKTKEYDGSVYDEWKQKYGGKFEGAFPDYKDSEEYQNAVKDFQENFLPKTRDEIRFEYLSDLVPYYGYIPATSASWVDDEGKRHISLTLSDEPEYAHFKENFPETYERYVKQINDELKRVKELEGRV